MRSQSMTGAFALDDVSSSALFSYRRQRADITTDICLEMSTERRVDEGADAADSEQWNEQPNTR